MLSPKELREHYKRFVRDDRVLLTGHSHQAWPDVALEGLIESFDHAAAHVDDKWAHAAEAARAVQSAAALQLGGKAESYALGPNTHELVTRFLSALPWKERRHIVTTDGEFHSMRRQLQRLSEEGIEISAIEAFPLDTLAERLAAALRDDTAALMVSTVLFETSSVVPHLQGAVAAARAVGAEVLLDAYHHFCALPWEPISDEAFVVAGGYKYAQWGEGACFLRVPSTTTLRPVYTGWFSDFASLGVAQSEVRYGPDGASRFAGSTYDPASHYRARRVVQFFAEQSMSIAALRQRSLDQTARLIDQLDFVPVLTPTERERRGGFVTVQLKQAGELAQALRERGIYVDARRDRLRFGPAPYTTDAEIDAAVEALREVLT